MDAGVRYVYIGNMRTEAENTYCHQCRKLVIERIGYFVKQVNMANGKCRYCGTAMPGVWS